MSSVSYPFLDYTSFFVSETYTPESYQAEQRRCGWSDDELAAIRVVLRKITALRVLNSNDAEDLVQDTLLTMIMKCPESNLEKGPLAWSMGILRKKLGNYYRKVQHYASLDDRESCACGHTLRGTTPPASPESKVRHEELRAIVDSVVARFPKAQREAMELLIEGFDTAEIAGQLYPERYQNIVNRLHRGRKKLTKELSKLGYRPGVRRRSRISHRMSA